MIVAILILALVTVTAYVFRDKWLPLVNKLHITSVSTAKAQDPASQSPASQAPSNVASQATNVSQPDTGTDNPFIRAYKQSNPQYVDVKPGDSGPGVSQVDAIGNVTFLEGGVGQNVVINGPGERYLTIPQGFTGSVRYEVTFNTGTKFPISAYVDGQLIGTRDTTAAIEAEFPVKAGERHTLRIDQADNSSVTAEFRAYRVA